MPPRAGSNPGGIPNFLAQAVLQPLLLTTPLYWAQSSGENVVRQERVVYDQTSTPVYIPPAPTAASVPLAYAYRETTAIPRRIVYSPTATPIPPPPAATPSEFGYQTGDAAVLRRRKILPDGVAVPLAPPAAALPVQPADVAVRTKGRTRLPDGFAAPVTVPIAFTPTPSEFGYQTVEATWRKQRKALPEGFTGPIEPPAAAVSITGTLASVHSTATVVISRVVYDPSAARPLFPPTAPSGTVTPSLAPPDALQNERTRSRVKPVQLSAFVFAYPVDDLADDYTGPFPRQKRKVLPDGVAQPPFQPVTVATVTPTQIGYQPVDVVWRKQKKALPEGFTGPIYPPVTVAAVSFQAANAYREAIAILRRVVYDPIAAPVFKPAAVTLPSILDQAEGPALQRRVSRPGIKLILEGIERPLFLPAFTPSYLFETIPPPWKATPNSKAISANLQGIERPLAEPAPPTATPAYLFDVIPAIQAHLPNRAAITINLSGIVWLPQDPADLTGSVTVPDTGLGGACRLGTKGPWLPYYREAREKDFKKSYKKKKYEELLEQLQAKADVPAVVVEAVSVLAGKTQEPRQETRADLASLVALVHTYQVNQPVVAPVGEPTDDEAEMIAMVVALEEDELKQIMALALMLMNDLEET